MIHNKIAVSKWSLPVMCVYGAVMCLAFGAIQEGWWLQALGLLLGAYLMMVLNNSYSLIRVYSRLVSCSFLALSTAASFLLPSAGGMIQQLLFIVSLLLLFQTYQNQRGMGYVFYAFMTISMMSIGFVQILYFVPLLWAMLAFRLQAPSVRNFLASVLGLLLPYWFWLAYALWHQETAILGNHLASLGRFEPLFGGLAEPHLLSTIIFIGTIGAVSSVNFIRKSFNDSIKTRMLHYTLMSISLGALVLLLLQPQHADPLVRMMIICSSAAIAHLFTFSKSRPTAIVFILSILAVLGLTVYNSWIR